MVTAADFSDSSPSAESSISLEDFTQTIPPELLQAAFSYLPTESFPFVRLVDKRWSTIVHNLLEPRCILLLKRIGMPTNFSSPLRSDKLLASLVRANKANPENLKAFQIKAAIALLERLGELERTETGRQLYDHQQEICEHLEILFNANYKPFTSKYGYDHENGAFIRVALELAKLGLKDGALRVARIGSPDSISNEKLEKISLELANAGLKDKAYQVIEQMGENPPAYAYINVLRELAKLGKIDPVAEVFKVILDTEKRIEALRYIGRDLRQPQILDTAMTLTLNLDDSRRISLLRCISQDLASIDEFQAAFNTAQTIPAGSDESMIVFSDLASNRAKRGLPDQALACLERLPAEKDKNWAYAHTIVGLRKFAKNQFWGQNEIDPKIKKVIDLLVEKITDESVLRYALSTIYESSSE